MHICRDSLLGLDDTLVYCILCCPTSSEPHIVAVCPSIIQYIIAFLTFELPQLDVAFIVGDDISQVDHIDHHVPLSLSHSYLTPPCTYRIIPNRGTCPPESLTLLPHTSTNIQYYP